MFGEFNLENWPVVYFKFNSNEINDELFEEYKKYYLNLLVKCKRNDEKMILICDLNYLNMNENFPLKYIMKQSQFSKETYKFNKEYVKCICILCKSKNFKTILNMYFGLAKPAAPFKLCRTNEKANLFIKDKAKIDFDISIYNQEISINCEVEEEDNDSSITNPNNEYNNEENNDENENTFDIETYEKEIYEKETYEKESNCVK